MSVEITPATQLGFPRPLTRLVTQSIKIHNPHPHPVAFKVKTTAPKQYCVRPNSGRVESGESVEVQVLLQPLTTEPPPHAKCKDKFLVQSAFITPDEEMRTLAEMWTQTERTNKSAIQEIKLKCVYLAPEDGAHANGIPEEEEIQESRVMDESNVHLQSYEQNQEQAFNTPIKGGNQHEIDALGKAGDGLSKWTTVPKKEYDSRVFKNGGHSVWETRQLPYVPSGPKQGKGAIFAAAPSSPTAARNGTSPTGSSLEPPIPATAQPPTASHPTLSNNAADRLPDLTAAQVSSVGTAAPTNSALERSLSSTTSDGDKVKVLLAEVERLQNQLGSTAGAGAGTEPQVTGLRRRGGGAVTGASVSDKAEVVVEKAKEVVAGNQGVPLEVVVGLVAATFVMTYLFF